MDVELKRGATGVAALRWTPRRLQPVSDDRLARMVGAGHEEAFATLYNRYHQRLYRYCRSMLGNDNDAQDALQSAFAGAYAALAQARRDAPVRPWLYRIAHNESVSLMRRRRPEVELAEDHVTPTASAADVADERRRVAVLMNDLGELTERQRAALVMRELSGLSHAEIATALTIDVPTAKQTIFEARRSLQQFAEGRAMVCDEVCQAISAGGGRTLRGRRVRAHLRDCRGCQDFAAAIPARTRDLKAIAPPLAATAATSILRRAIASTSGHGGGGGVGVAAGTAGKAAGMLAVGKALAGAAAVVTVAAGAGGIVPSLVQSPAPSSPAGSRASYGTATRQPGSVMSAAGPVHAHGRGGGASVAGRRGAHDVGGRRGAQHAPGISSHRSGAHQGHGSHHGQARGHHGLGQTSGSAASAHANAHTGHAQASTQRARHVSRGSGRSSRAGGTAATSTTHPSHPAASRPAVSRPAGTTATGPQGAGGHATHPVTRSAAAFTPSHAGPPTAVAGRQVKTPSR